MTTAQAPFSGELRPFATPGPQLTRTRLCRAAIYGAPCLAAALSVSLFWLGRRPSSFVARPIVDAVLLGNAAAAVLAAACATACLTGAARLRILGGFAYGVLALIVYGILTVAGITAIAG